MHVPHFGTPEVGDFFVSGRGQVVQVLCGAVGARRKRTKANDAEAEQAEWEVLFPVRELELQSGRKVVVRQWNIDQGALLTPRVVRLMQKLREAGLGGDVELEDMLELARPECKGLVYETIGWTEKELDQRASFDDFLVLFQAVIDTSLVREDGEGALKKIVGLAAALGPLGESLPQVRSTSSSAPATPSPTSGE